MSNAQMSIVLFRVTSLIIDIEAGNVNWVPGGRGGREWRVNGTFDGFFNDVYFERVKGDV